MNAAGTTRAVGGKPSQNGGNRLRTIALLLLPATVLMLVFVAALVILLSYTLRPSVTVAHPLTLNAYARFLSDPYSRLLTRNTLVLGAVVTLGTLIVGYPTAYALARLRNPGLVLVVSLALFSPLLVSVVIRAYGWLVLFSNKGLINFALERLGLIREPLRLLYTPWSVDVSLIHILMPFMVFPIYSVLRQIDASMEEAAEDLGSGPWQTFRRVTWPLSLPGVIAGVQIVFSLCISAYVSPALLGGGHVLVLAPAIYQTTIDIDWPLAGVMTLALLLLSLLVLLAVNVLSRRIFAHEQTGRAGTAPASSRHPAIYGWLALVAAFMVLPIAIVVIDSFNSVAYSVFPPPGVSLRWYEHLFTAVDWRPALRNSLIVACSASVIAVGAGTLAAYAMARYVAKGRELVRVIFFGPFLVPRIGIGLAFFILMLKLRLYGSLLSLVAAHAVITLPFAAAIMSAAFVAVPRVFEESAMDLGAGPARTFLTVVVPQVAPAVLVSFVFVFIASLDELETSLFLVRPGNQTIPIAMLTYMFQYQDPTIAALASLLVGLSVLAVAAVVVLIRRGRVGNSLAASVSQT
ncbi:MAG TPA: ABC transporter permease subunit [bacterium]|nr:ABC transporter permease subunit [bacterium]